VPINSAPLIDKLNVSDVWLRWFANLGTSLEGDWDLYTASLVFTGTGTQEVSIQSAGKSAIIQIKINSATDGALTLPFRAKDTILRVWDNDSQTLIGGASVSGSLVQLPLVSGNILIEGTVVKWTL
jgi:hypothetical protein